MENSIDDIVVETTITVNCIYSRFGQEAEYRQIIRGT